MATNNVRFLAGDQAVFKNLYDNNQLDANAFYYVRGDDDTSLYLGYMRLSNTPEINTAVARITTNEGEIDEIKKKLLELVGNPDPGNPDAPTGSIDEKIAAAINPIKDFLGNENNTLTTNEKTVTGAINELKGIIEHNDTAAEVTIITDDTTEGALKSYTVKQGATTVGIIDIPKDLVVTSGTVEVDPPTLDPGTYIKLVIANQDNPLYINVGTLVDIYSAEQDPAQIQISVNQTTRKIGATILAGAVNTTELADNAVTTVKIADGAVTKAKLATDAVTADKIASGAVGTDAIADKAITGGKIADGTIGLGNLSDEVKTSLGAADTAIKDIISGTANGTIGKVVADPEGTAGATKIIDVPVKGLQSAAFVDVNAFVSATDYSANKTVTDKAIQDNADAIAALVGGSLTWINFDETNPNPDVPITIE